MRPEDAVKLLYQSEFGVGHMIKSPEEFEKYLAFENSRTEKEESVPLVEDIGYPFVRVNLASPLFGSVIDVKALTSLCLESVKITKGSETDLVQDLGFLAFLSALDGYAFDFSKEELDEYIYAYIGSGIVPVHHSNTYIALYNPAYRVCRLDAKGGESLLKYLE